MVIKNSAGNLLKDGDKIKNIKLIDDFQNIEFRICKSQLVIIPQFIESPF